MYIPTPRLIPTSVPQHPDAGTTELASAVASNPNDDWLAVSCSALGMIDVWTGSRQQHGQFARLSYYHGSPNCNGCHLTDGDHVDTPKSHISAPQAVFSP